MATCGSCSREVPSDRPTCPACGSDVGVQPSDLTLSADSPEVVVDGGLRRKLEERFLPGTMLADRFRIVRLIGRGGMGEIYRADDLQTDQPVALKFLPESLCGQEMRDRLANEVRIAQRVSHPNVCRVFDVFDIDGHHFLSMEYVDGEDLASLLRRIGRLPCEKALDIARQLCASLSAAHNEGVLHRDLKPANIMIDGCGRVRITDFGLAGLAKEFTGAEIRAGTPSYMSPEQITGREVTVRSDIYALGLVLYELFAGRRAFSADTALEVSRMHRTEAPTRLSEIVADIDPMVESVILACLEKDPALRPATAKDVAAALDGVSD